MTRLFLLAALTIALAVPAGAQGNSQSERHTIDVTANGSACTYEIQGQANQQAFEVSPGDRLRLQGRSGTKATFDFLPDDTGVAPLNRGSQRVEVQGNGETITVRSARQQTTNHEVIIKCCTDRRGNTCNGWTRARAARGGVGVRMAPLPGVPASGPAAGEGPTATAVAGDPPPSGSVDGPRMQVKE